MNQITWTFSVLTELRVWAENCIVEVGEKCLPLVGVVEEEDDDLGPFVEDVGSALFKTSVDFVVVEVIVDVEAFACIVVEESVVVVGVFEVALPESVLYDTTVRLPTIAQLLSYPLNQLHSQRRVGCVLH